MVTYRFPHLFAFLALIALTCGPAQSQTTERAPDTMAARVLACASCHGAAGEGTSDVYFPRLAGKPAGCQQMRNIARQMTAEEIDQVARYYEAQP
jgi:cytochrome c553